MFEAKSVPTSSVHNSQTVTIAQSSINEERSSINEEGSFINEEISKNITFVDVSVNYDNLIGKKQRFVQSHSLHSLVPACTLL